MSHVSSRFASFGSSVFTEITAAARRAGAVDLGQGYPTWEGPDLVKQAAVDAIWEQSNQYPPPTGLPVLREAIASRWKIDTGMEADPDTEITVTSGCTEALAATVLGLVEPGDEVVLIEPFYDSYPVCVSMAGARVRSVVLRPPDFAVPLDDLARVFNDMTKVIIVNSPHNPTGRVFSPEELDGIADLCRRHDAIAVTDEVYEHMTYDTEFARIASREGMWERTVSLSSTGKTFSLTGWKTGWAIAPPHLTEAVRAAHQFLTYTVPNPMQWGTAAGLRADQTYFDDLRTDYKRRRDHLAAGLGSVGFNVFLPQGTYFMLADHTGFGTRTDVEFVRHLIEDIGVAAIPPSFFYTDPSDGADLVRFAFCKDDKTMDTALDRLQEGLAE
ncbi:MAG: aminotransferase class I/II-fold pyridoxal phosphate-dependent enzyme [Acidimicrobiia bacterium]|nr:aminotransferase class I/II-fold pyridoxal phosphate-dependent enzyme [Acidimicrobiia bacterium]